MLCFRCEMRLGSGIFNPCQRTGCGVSDSCSADARIVFVLAEAIDRFFHQILTFHFWKKSRRTASFSNLGLRGVHNENATLGVLKGTRTVAGAVSCYSFIAILLWRGRMSFAPVCLCPCHCVLHFMVSLACANFMTNMALGVFSVIGFDLKTRMFSCHPGALRILYISMLRSFGFEIQGRADLPSCFVFCKKRSRWCAESFCVLQSRVGVRCWW